MKSQVKGLAFDSALNSLGLCTGTPNSQDILRFNVGLCVFGRGRSFLIQPRLYAFLRNEGHNLGGGTKSNYIAFIGQPMFLCVQPTYISVCSFTVGYFFIKCMNEIYTPKSCFFSFLFNANAYFQKEVGFFSFSFSFSFSFYFFFKQR